MPKYIVPAKVEASFSLEVEAPTPAMARAQAKIIADTLFDSDGVTPFDRAVHHAVYEIKIGAKIEKLPNP